jgi:hypothetical protein
MKKSNPFFQIGIILGILGFILLLLIFIPPMFGAASDSDIEKYNGHSDAGNQTVIAVDGINSIFTSGFSGPFIGLIIIIVFMLAVAVGAFLYNLLIKRKGKK